jgi:ATP-dependent exoDNAse (exonuclease V) alpha subunit
MRHHFEQLSVVPYNDLAITAMEHSMGGATPEDIEREAIRQGVLLRQMDGQWFASTSELMREEDGLVGFAAGGRGTVPPVGVPEGLERGTLNDGQWQAVRGLLNSTNRVNFLLGPAGAGKSYSLKAFDDGMRMAGETVTYLATTSDAVKVLADDGFEVNTLARFLLDPELQESARGGTVVCDEVSLLGHKDAVKLFSLADKLGVRLILSGDQLQHSSVPRGSLIHLLTTYAGITPFRLEEIRRQEEAGYLSAVKMLSEGNTVEGFDALDGKGWVREIASDQERYTQLAADYIQGLKDKKSVLIVSPTHAEAAKITAELRSQLRAAGKLGKEEREVTRLVAANASEAERGEAKTYRKGDVLVFHQNAKGFTKGDRVIVTDPANVPVSEASKYQLYRTETMNVAKDDKLRFTATVKTIDGKHTLKNGMIKSVAGFTEGGDMRLDNGWIVSKDSGHWRLGWVDTSFAAQGKTVQRVLLGMAAASAPAMSQENFYVSASRGKEKMTLYTDNKEAVRDAVQKSSGKLAALDLRQMAKPKLADRLRKLLERRRRHRVVQRMRAAWERRGRQAFVPPRTPPRSPDNHRGRVTARQEERDTGRAR